jgi:hypothetical protein
MTRYRSPRSLDLFLSYRKRTVLARPAPSQRVSTGHIASLATHSLRPCYSPSRIILSNRLGFLIE